MILQAHLLLTLLLFLNIGSYLSTVKMANIWRRVGALQMAMLFMISSTHAGIKENSSDLARVMGHVITKPTFSLLLFFSGLMWLRGGSCIRQLLTGHAFIWSLILRALVSRKSIYLNFLLEVHYQPNVYWSVFSCCLCLVSLISFIFICCATAQATVYGRWKKKRDKTFIELDKYPHYAFILC